MDSVVLWTLLAIFLTSMFGVLLSRRKKDICLKDFHGYMATAQLKNGKRVWGRLQVETSGIEFCYAGNYWDEDHIETSFIIFKEELGELFVLFRFLDEQAERSTKRRQRKLQKSYHPWPPRRLARKVRNLFNSIKDAVSEGVGTAVAQAKTSNRALQTMGAQQKYINKAQGDLLGFVASSYDPMLERHIGMMVVLEINTPKGIEEHVGVFREYSQQYLEVMDVAYRDGDRERICDMIVPRAHAFIRHSAEEVKRATRPDTRKEAEVKAS